VIDGVCVAAGGGACVYDAVGVGVVVEIKVEVGEGGWVDVGGTEVKEAVEDGKTSVMVTPGRGVRVGMFGTHNR
jgi:hypothetical protein